MQTFSDLIDKYVAGPAELRKAVAGMTHDHLIARPVANRWSTLEVVVHISDFEPILADRMKRIIALERPMLLVADENLFVDRLSYHERDINEELDIIELTRKQMARVLRKLPPAEATSRYGVHSFKGLITLEAVVTAAVNHIPNHLTFVADKRKALGI
jgi:hypothetical protein